MKLMGFPQPWAQAIFGCKDSEEAAAVLKAALESMSNYKFKEWDKDDNCVVIDDEGKDSTWEDVTLSASNTDALIVIETINEDGRIEHFNYLLAKRLADTRGSD